ncbi:MAG TPA: uroporphyrinogen decarboxylase [Limnochordales bacterium]|nr:uroporphyrinogen decarboxylase [Limnochordales bacterium]
MPAWNDRFLRACRREPVDRTPVWFMRQAGRYQPEYRALRERYTLLEICREPELCAQVTRLPVEQLGVDAAILFSDIMVPLGPMGVEYELQENVGPVIAAPIAGMADVERLRPLVPEESLDYVLATIRLLVRELPVPLIGFVGGPFTLASYLIEGRPSRRFLRTKEMMYREPAVWHALLERLTDMAIVYLRAQTAAGAHAVQVFDSWVGSLSPSDYRTYVLPHMERLFAETADLDVPRIHFGVGTLGLLPLMRSAGSEVIGVDWRVDIGTAWELVGYDVAVQGNLDPALLLAPDDVLRRRVQEVLVGAGGRPGHIFNLGHGVLPQTSPQRLRQVVEWVHGMGGDKDEH